MTSHVPFDLDEPLPTGGIEVFAQRAIVRRGYHELFADVRRARDRLAAAELKRGDVVGLLGENRYELIVYDFALLAMGCIPVAFPETMATLGPDTLAERYELSLLLVTQQFAREARPWIEVIDAPGAQSHARDSVTGEIRNLARRSDLCAVIFSSGSSGELKPIALSRCGVETVFDSLIAGYALSPGDRVFVALPLSIFQQRVLVYSALRAGADICFTDPASLFHALRALSPNVVLAPPSLFETIEDRGYPAERLTEVFGGRPRLLLTGSAPSRISTLAYFESAGLPIFQVYGMAEVGFIAWNRPGANCPGSVGQPVHPGSVTISADDEILVSVPARQALGYLGAARDGEGEIFLADGRIATGDLGRLDQAGNLFIEGRKKDVIVTRSGRKLPVRTVESALEAIDGINRAVLVGGGDFPWPVAIVATAFKPSASRQEAIETAAAAIVAEHNRSAESDERIGRLMLIDQPFTVENGLLTRNLKLNRSAIARRFADRLLGQAG